jgi:hypothetical protein
MVGNPGQWSRGSSYKCKQSSNYRERIKRGRWLIPVPEHRDKSRHKNLIEANRGLWMKHSPKASKKIVVTRKVAIRPSLTSYLRRAPHVTGQGSKA